MIENIEVMSKFAVILSPCKSVSDSTGILYSFSLQNKAGDLVFI